MALDKNLDFINELTKRYNNKLVFCDICNKSIPFKKFVTQYNQTKLYCSKKCKFKDPNKDNKEVKFASRTEQAIFIFLSLEYQNSKIDHNISDFIPPFEIDFKIDNIFIEYNGSFHISSKRKGLERKIEKTKLNDKTKKELICINNNKSLIRIWAEIGLYSRPKLFNDVLLYLKNRINYLKSNNILGICIEICIDKDENIHVFEN